MINELKEVLDNGWFLAVRATRSDEQYAVEDLCRQSYEWDLENDVSSYFTTGELAGGTCGLEVDTNDCTAEELSARVAEAVEKVRAYGDVGGQIIVIAGRRLNTNFQMDDGEARIVDAWVQYIVE